MKTNVSIKFNSVEEYREIEKKLTELGYESVKEWNNEVLKKYINNNLNSNMFLVIYSDKEFEIYSHQPIEYKTYNSLQEFLNDIKWNLQ